MHEREYKQQLVEAVVGLIWPEVERLITERVQERLPKPSPWMDAKQAGEYLGISAAAVRQRVYAGTLGAHYDAGGKMRFRREDLDATMTPFGPAR